MARDTKKMYKQRKEKYHQRKENGLCPKCGKQTDGIHTMCEECRREQRERYHWYSEHGICPKCQGDVAPGKSYAQCASPEKPKMINEDTII